MGKIIVFVFRKFGFWGSKIAQNVLHAIDANGWTDKQLTVGQDIEPLTGLIIIIIENIKNYSQKLMTRCMKLCPKLCHTLTKFL